MSEAVRKSVLVVDDTPTNINILMEILAEDYDVLVALDGESALESVDENMVVLPNSLSIYSAFSCDVSIISQLTVRITHGFKEP